jgi:hypothetical protein
MVLGTAYTVTAGTASSAQATLPAAPLVFLSGQASTQNWFAMPAPVVGMVIDIINLNTASMQLGGNAPSQSIQGVSSQNAYTLAGSASATSAASLMQVCLACDGANWWRRGV